MFNTPSENAHYLSRLDNGELLGTVSNHPIQLEDLVWPTVEHYVQAMQFEDDSKREKIRMAATADQARKLGKTGWFNRPRENWENLRSIYMTRALYTKCRAHPEVARALLATGDEHLVENDQYDYYWGCGRDRRGDNTFGKVLMQVRDKLKEEQAD
ncbi:MAG: NADAR family protein [Pseudomonadales bacterium]|nr:NADAR family protein [Pseudomonadales bacterium]